MSKRILSILLILAITTGIIAGCDRKTNDDLTEGLQMIDNSDKFIGDNKEDDLLQSGLGSPGQKVDTYSGLIGCGYDVINSPYYQADYVRMRILDVDKMAEDGVIYEDKYSFTKTEFTIEAGENISSYMKSLAVNAGMSSSSLFGGSLKVDFGLDSQTKVSEKQSFAKGSVIITKTMQSASMGNITFGELRDKYILQKFKDNWLLNPDVSPKELFENCGTHIMLKVYLGGRLDMSYIYNNVENHDVMKIKTSVEASYGVVSGTASTATENESNKFLSKSITRIRTEGGSVDTNMTSFESAKENYKEWAESIQQNEYITLIKAGRLSSTSEMFPIWMLIDTSTNPNATPEEKKAENLRKKRYNDLLAEYNKQLEESAKNLSVYQTQPTYIKDIYFGAGKSGAGAISDLYSQYSGEMYIIEKDLNHRAGGYWIYLGYTVTTDPKEAITGLVLRYEENKPSKFTYKGSEYTLIEKYDLNRDAGGYYIYCYYTKDSKAGSPVKNLFVSINDDFSGRQGLGWLKVADWARPDNYNDLNKSAGGSDVYLWMQK